MKHANMKGHRKRNWGDPLHKAYDKMMTIDSQSTKYKVRCRTISE